MCSAILQTIIKHFLLFWLFHNSFLTKQSEKLTKVAKVESRNKSPARFASFLSAENTRIRAAVWVAGIVNMKCAFVWRNRKLSSLYGNEFYMG